MEIIRPRKRRIWLEKFESELKNGGAAVMRFIHFDMYEIHVMTPHFLRYELIIHKKNLIKFTDRQRNQETIVESLEEALEIIYEREEEEIRDLKMKFDWSNVGYWKN